MADCGSDGNGKLRLSTWWIFVIILLIVLAGFTVFRAIQEARLNRRLDAIREAGYPVTLAELNQYYHQVPASRNAALVYAQAFAKYDDDWMDDEPEGASDKGGSETATIELQIVEEGEMPEGAWSPALLVRADKCLKANAKALKLLHQAAAMSECRFPVDLSDILDLDTPHHADLRKGARLLQLHALVSMERGDFDGAASLVGDMFCLGRSLRGEPLMTSQYVLFALTSMSKNTLRRMFDKDTPNEDALCSLQNQIAEILKSEDSMAASLASERCMGVFFLSSLRMQPGRFGWVHFLVGTSAGDRVNYLDGMGQAISVASEPYSVRIQALPKLKEAESTLLKMRQASILIPSLTAYVLLGARDCARLHLALAAIAAERYRLKHGSLPESLDALVPNFLEAIPMDPFDGKPVRYKRLEKGYCLYSIGENLVDDGGKGRPKKNERPLDIVFEIHR